MANPYLFIGPFIVAFISHGAIKYARYTRNADNTNTTNLDTALMIADELVLPGLEFTFACQPVKAITSKIGIALLSESLILLTSTVKNIIHAAADYNTPSPLHFGATFVEDFCKEIPIVACKISGSSRITCNIIGEGTKELSRLFVYDERANTLGLEVWLNKIPKSIAKTAHQIIEKGLCVEKLGDQWGYVACGWARSLFYKAPSFIISTYQKYFFNSQEQKKLNSCKNSSFLYLSEPCPPEAELQLQPSSWNTNYKASPPNELGSRYIHKINENRVLFLLSPKLLILFGRSQQVDVIAGTWFETFGAVIDAKAKTEYFSDVAITRESEILNEGHFIHQTANVKSSGDHHFVYEEICLI